MASIFSYRCKCGRVYSIYVPKEMQFKEMFGDPKMIEEGRLIDKREQEAGEVENARRIMTEEAETEFRDASVNEVIQCECGEVFDVLAFYRELREKGKKRKKIEQFLRERMGLKEDKNEKRERN